MQKFANEHPEILDYGLSKTEGGTGHAIYAKPELPMTNPVAKKIRCEIAHVHPSENSLHVHISTRDAREIITARWGMRFSVQGLAPPSWVSAIQSITYSFSNQANSNGVDNGVCAAG